MRRYVFIFLVLFTCFTQQAHAASEFTSSYNITYDIHETSGATVTKQISIKNNTAEYYASDFSLRIPDNGITNLKAVRNNKELPLSTQTKDNMLDVYIKFNDQVLGLGKTINFTVTYDAKDLAKNKGKNLEVIIPGIGKEYEGSYEVQVQVPKIKISKNARIYPKPSSQSESDSIVIYKFIKSQLTESSVLMNFGDSQSYDLSVIYNLNNDTSTRVRYEVALPPSTEYQTVIYDSLEPRPQEINIDIDGNYLAKYILEPNEGKQIQLKTQAIVGATIQNNFPPLADNLKSLYLSTQEYWSVDDPKIQELAKKYQTPKAIYDYVVQTLNYDKERVDIASLRRQGSLEALANPDKAVCMEFTDLFIAIARAAGIPAREVDGYGFTDDEADKTTLFADSFHAWPEYYDEKQSRWIQVDPTWQKTTGGFDYFNSFDTNHITFVRRGISSTSPVGAGAYRRNADDKTVFISYSDKTPQPNSSIEAELDNETRLAGFADKAEVTLTNTGNVGYIGNIQINFQPKGLVSDSTTSVHIPPFSHLHLNFPFQIKWNEYQKLDVQVNDTKNQSLIKSSIQINPLYTHPYTIVALSYLIALLVIIVLFNKFISHKP